MSVAGVPQQGRWLGVEIGGQRFALALGLVDSVLVAPDHMQPFPAAALPARLCLSEGRVLYVLDAPSLIPGAPAAAEANWLIALHADPGAACAILASDVSGPFRGGSAEATTGSVMHRGESWRIVTALEGRHEP